VGDNATLTRRTCHCHLLLPCCGPTTVIILANIANDRVVNDSTSSYTDMCSSLVVVPTVAGKRHVC
jgi:hypothetical protein